MGFKSDLAKESFEMFQNLRDEIKRHGLNQARFNFITNRLAIISEAISTNPEDQELSEVRAMGASLIRR
jgi:hypothetical protein